MASTLYETLNNIEKGRQNCIKNAKLANLEASDSMSIYDIGELFLQKNTDKFINKNNPEVGGGWQRPSDWWNTKDILANAEGKESLHPAYILLLADTQKTTTFTKSATGAALRYDGILTSDGKWYTEDNVEHTWDTSQDKECSDGYKTRYAIIYVNDPTNIAKIELNQFSCLEFIAGNITLKNDGLFFGNNNVSKANLDILSIEYTAETVQETINTSSFANHCTNLKNVSMPTIKRVTAEHIFYQCYSLINISLPALTELNGDYEFSYCSSLTSISFPSLIKISGNNVFYYCSSLKNISIPFLSELNGNYTFNYCHSLENISLPKLETIKGYNTFLNCSKLTDVELPILVSIVPDSSSTTATFSGCCSLKNISMPLLQEVKNDSLFNGNYALENISLPNLSLITGATNNFLTNCVSLTSLSLPKLSAIEGSTFFLNCASLTDVSLPMLKTVNCSSIFENCYSLTNVSLLALTTITGYAFKSCPSLSSFEFPSTIEKINFTNTFKSCYFLKNIKLLPDWKFTGLNISDCNLTITSIIQMLNDLADVNSLDVETNYTLTLGTNNLSKLSDEEKQIATNKGWTLN